MSTLSFAHSQIPLWTGASGSLDVEFQGDPTKPIAPGSSPIASASFQVAGSQDMAFASTGTVGIGIHAGAHARIVPVFKENQGAGLDLVTRFDLGGALTPTNFLLALELGGEANLTAEGAFTYSVLSAGATLEAGADATYVATRAFKRDVTAGQALGGLLGTLALPGGVTMPPGPGELVSFEYGGVLKYSVGASAGYELKGTKSLKVSEIALSEHYALSVIGKLTLSGQLAGRFSVDVTEGSQRGYARVVVRRRRLKELQFAADVNATASLATDGLPKSGKEFLGALLGVEGKNWLNLVDSIVTKAGQVDSVATLKAKLDGLAMDYMGAFAGKAIEQLTSVPEVKAFQDKLAKVVRSYRQLDQRAIALFDHYFDPVLNRLDALTSALDKLSSMNSWEELAGEVDPTLWNVLRQLTDGDPLDWALGMIPGTNTASLPELKKGIADALAMIKDAAHQEIRDFIRVAKEQFGLDPFFNQLATISRPDDLKALADAKLKHFVERLIGKAIDSLNGNALKEAFEIVKKVVARRDAFFTEFDEILEEAAAQTFSRSLHAAYNSSSEQTALVDIEIKLVDSSGLPNLTGQRFIAAAGRGDFQEVLAKFQPAVVTLREGLLTHKVTSGTTLTFNVAGWHHQFNYQSMHSVIVDTKQQIRDSGNGLVNVFTTTDLTVDAARRKRGSKGEEAVLSNFLLRVLGETKVSDSSFDPKTMAYAIDVITGMSARYSVTFTDENTSSEELNDYLQFAKELGLDAVGATRAALEPVLELTTGGFGRTSSVYEVRYVPAAIQRLVAVRPSVADIKGILRRIVLANLFGDPALHDVGWLYSSDDVRTLFDDNGGNFVNAQSILGSATVRFTSPIAGILPPSTFRNTLQIREDVAVLFRIEDQVVRAFQDLTNLLQSTDPIKTRDLENRLNAFGKALDAFDQRDEGENSIFAVFDGLIQLASPGARASSLTFTSVKDGADRTKVFTLRADV